MSSTPGTQDRAAQRERCQRRVGKRQCKNTPTHKDEDKLMCTFHYWRSSMTTPDDYVAR